MAVTGTTEYGNGLLVLTVDTDPRSTAVDAPSGSVIVFVGTDTATIRNGDTFRKLDDGSTTNVSESSLKNSFAETTDPGVSDDNTQDYQIGSLWINVTLDKAFICLNAATGAAVWTQTTASGSTDADAIHDNVAAEISAVAAKGTPTAADFLLIEDAADSDNKKSITIGDLPGGGGGDVSLGNGYAFSTTITDADPGSGNFRFNNATQASATFMFVSDISENGTDLSEILLRLARGDLIYIQETGDKTKFHLVEVGDGIVDATGYVKIPITVVDSGTDLTDTTACTLILARASGNILTVVASDTVSLQAALQLAIDAKAPIIIKIRTDSSGFIAIGGGNLPTGQVSQNITFVPDMSVAEAEADPAPKINFTNGWVLNVDDQVTILFDGVDLDFSGTNDSFVWGMDQNGFFEARNCTIDVDTTGSPIVRNDFDGKVIITFRSVTYIATGAIPGLVQSDQNTARLEDTTSEIILIGCKCSGRLAKVTEDNEIVNIRVIASTVEDNGNGIWDVGSGSGEMNVIIGTGSFVDVSSGSVVGSTNPTFTFDAPASDIAEASGDITTTSVTDVLATSMTLTPAAGTYLVWFTGSVDHSANNATMFLSIYLGGVQEASSEREFGRGAGQGDVTNSFACAARVSVDGTQAIEGRWRTPSSTATMHERTLQILRVGGEE